MAVQEVQAFRFDCDACGKYEVVPHPSEYTGYTGSVQLDGVDADWVAHQAGCINKAIKTVLARAKDDRKPTPSATLVLADETCPGSGRQAALTEEEAHLVGGTLACPVCTRSVSVTATGKIRKHTAATKAA
jgi:hypothetical protein